MSDIEDDPPPKTYKIWPTLTSEQAEMLGYVVAFWAHLENSIAMMATHLLDISDEEGRVVFTQMNTRPRLEVISLLLDSRVIYKKDRERFAEFRSAIEDAQAKRNLVAHGLWSEDEDGNRVVIQMWGGKGGIKRLEFEPHPMDYAKIDSIAQEIATLASEFTAWWHEVKERLMPSTYRSW